MNITDHNTNFEMEVTAPEFSKKDFKVSIENGVLIISSKRKEEKINVTYTNEILNVTLQKIQKL